MAVRSRRHGLGRPWLKAAVLMLLAAATVVLCYLALTRDTSVDGFAVDDSPASSAPGPGEEPAADQPELPVVPDQRRADFGQGDDLPDGARVLDTGRSATGIAVRDGVLTHGSPVRRASGLVETRLKSDVTSLGFRVRFADDSSGSASLVAWQHSAVKAARSGAPAPPTGLRLVVSPGQWQLSVVDGDEDVIAEGTYAPAPGPAVFQVLRDGAQLFVVDPSGAVSTATQARVAELAGPWASWGLSETGPKQTPAAIEAVWAG